MSLSSTRSWALAQMVLTGIPSLSTVIRHLVGKSLCIRWLVVALCMIGRSTAKHRKEGAADEEA